MFIVLTNHVISIFISIQCSAQLAGVVGLLVSVVAVLSSFSYVGRTGGGTEAWNGKDTMNINEEITELQANIHIVNPTPPVGRKGSARIYSRAYGKVLVGK